MIHVAPSQDSIQHNTGHSTVCECDPDIEYIDPEDGMPYARGPLVKHRQVSNMPTQWNVYDTLLLEVEDDSTN